MISPDGVVGSVLHVESDSVHVQLSVDARFGVDVEDERTHARGFVRGTGDASKYYCKVENVDAVPRERYACLVVYGGSSVTFVYSYTDDFYGAPACEFACSPR